MLISLVVIIMLLVYLIIDFARLIEHRISQEYLRHAWKRSAFWLMVMLLLTAALGAISDWANVSLLQILYIAAVFQAIIAIVILVTTYRNMHTARAVRLTGNIAEKDLPTVTVCIPARNETHDLEECLRTLIASNYPKLEILVLDDQSQERRTPEIIRGFAQDGVRFLAGKEPPSKWLAKNFAYEQLAAEANGEILLFCGVDARFSPNTVTNLIRQLIQTDTYMVSVLPRNVLKSGQRLGQSLIQPARYAWELALPRQLINRPPVLSTCWLIKRDELEALGGFSAIRHKATPENYFTQQISKKSKYKFVISDNQIGLDATKSLAEQRSTAIRTRYPQLHRRPELVAMVSIAEVFQLFWPSIILVVAAFQGNILLTIISLIASIANFVVFSLMVNLTYRQFIIGGLFVLPLAALYDVCLLNYSMWQYEFGEVVWKGRNISKPIMEVIPKLPEA